MTTRGERTREQILGAAELLHGERGVDGVSLREIRLASGQRDTTAIQLHVGDADGVLRALAGRHMPLLDHGDWTADLVTMAVVAAVAPSRRVALTLGR